MTLDLEQITQEDGFIHAYTDGSYSRYNHKIGSGVVFATNNILNPATIYDSVSTNQKKAVD